MRAYVRLRYVEPGLVISTALNNREIAVLSWLGIAFVFMLSKRDLRGALARVAIAAAHPAIVISTVTLAGYTAVIAILAAQIGLWQPDLIKETAIWFIGIGLGLLMNVGHVSERDCWFRREAVKAVRITVFVEFFVNLAVLSLPIELLLVLLLTLLAMMSAVAEDRADLQPAKSCTDGLLALAGAGLFLYVTVHVATDWENFSDRQTLQTLALPIWLTLSVLPFIYAVGVWSAYQSAFGSINGETATRRRRIRAKLALVLGLGLRAREIGEFRLFEARRLSEAADSLHSARSAVRKFRAGLAEERQAIIDQENRLKKYAGVEGTDQEGRQLDQREFAETKEALQYLALAQSGWYSNPEQRYRDDLLPLLAPFSGLPDEHGISMEVAPDGQSWWAWRRTITGWRFAIGAAGPPPDEWLYDGPDVPAGFPGKDPAWGERWGLEATNWMG